MGFIEELWLICKSGKNRGKPRFLKRFCVDDTSLLTINSKLNLVNKKGRETPYLIEKIEHVVYSVPKDEYNYGTEYFARVFVKRY